MERWHAEFGRALEDYLAVCSTLHGISRTDLASVLGHPIGIERDRVDLLPWLPSLQSAFFEASSGSPVRFDELSGGAGTTGFLKLIEPVLRQARKQLRDGVASLSRAQDVAFACDERIENELLRSAERQLLQMLIPALLLELNVARIRGLLEGDTPEARFASLRRGSGSRTWR